MLDVNTTSSIEWTYDPTSYRLNHTPVVSKGIQFLSSSIHAVYCNGRRHPTYGFPS